FGMLGGAPEPGGATGVVTVTGDQFTNNMVGVGFGSSRNWAASLTVQDSNFTDNTDGLDSSAGSLAVSGSTFTDNRGSAMNVSNDADLSKVLLAGAGANVFVGDGPARVVSVSSSVVPAGATWAVSSAGGAIPDLGSGGYYDAAVTVDGAVTIAAGS